MTKAMKKILMTASCLTIVMAAIPAMANPSVLCSVRANYDAATGDAAYTPGVDAKGKPVVSADVSEQMSVPALKQTLRIPLDIDLAQRLNEVMPDGAKLEANMGLVEVSPDGKVVINGKDLTAPTTAMCNNIEKQKAAALKTKDAPKVKKKSVVKPVEPAEPVAPVAAEAPAVDAPVVEAAPAPEVAAPEPVPQVLQPTPEAVAAPEVAAPAAPDVVAAPPAIVPQTMGGAEPAPVPALAAPADDGIVSPTEGGMAPRPPVDPLTGQPEPTPPAPAPMNNDANGGMLSGGAQ